MHERPHIQVFKEELAWAIDKQLRLIINATLFKAVIYTTKNLKNKAILI